MARSSPTRDYVRIIAQELMDGGTQPTPTRVRQLIEERYGIKSSPNVVSEELSRFWGSQGPAAKVEGPEGAGAEAVPEALQAVWHAALEVAREEVRRLDPVTQARESVRNARLIEELQSTRDERDALRQHNAELAQALEEAEASAFAQRPALQALHEQHQRLQQSLAEREQWWRQQQAFFEEQQQQLEARYEQQLALQQRAKEREFEIWDGLRTHLLLETDRIREEFTSQLVTLKAQLERSVLAEEQWRRQALNRNDELRVAQRRIAELEDALPPSPDPRDEIPAEGGE